MSDRDDPATRSYRNPPIEHRFRKGVSGNTKGRPRKKRAFVSTKVDGQPGIGFEDRIKSLAINFRLAVAETGSIADRDRFAGRPSGIRRAPARSPPTCDGFVSGDCAAAINHTNRRRLCRERKVLIAERVKHVNRIKGLLFSQGVSGYEPLRRDRRRRLQVRQQMLESWRVGLGKITL
jgi:hypothetical protein